MLLLFLFSSWERDLHRSSLIFFSQCLRLRAHVFAVCLSVSLSPSLLLSFPIRIMYVCVYVCDYGIDLEHGMSAAGWCRSWSRAIKRCMGQRTSEPCNAVNCKRCTRCGSRCMYIFGLGQMSSPYTDRKEVYITKDRTIFTLDFKP